MEYTHIDLKDEISNNKTFAFQFAQNLLMPEVKFREKFKEGLNVIQLGKYFGVPYEYVSIRIRDLGL